MFERLQLLPLSSRSDEHLIANQETMKLLGVLPADFNIQTFDDQQGPGWEPMENKTPALLESAAEFLRLETELVQDTGSRFLSGR